MSTRTKVSAFILVIVGLHALPVLSYQGAQQTRWPFLTWAMYAQSYPPGPIQAFVRQLVAVSADGTTRPITSHDVGLTVPALESRFVRPWSRGDTAAGRWLVDRLNRVGPDSIAQLRLESLRYRLVHSGIAVDTLPAVVYPASRATR